MTSLAKRLIEAREDKVWTKADLRRAAKLKSASTLTELEKGEITDSPQLPVIAEALGVEVLWLQHGRGPKVRQQSSVNAADVQEYSLEQLRKYFASRLAVEHEKEIKQQIATLEYEIWQLREPIHATGTHSHSPSSPIRRGPGKK